MSGIRLAIFFLLIVALDLMLFGADASPWSRRRRRRRRRRVSLPPPPPPCDSSMPYPKIKWANKWHKSFRSYCPTPYSMTQWISLYRKCQQDRIHHFRCRLGPALYDASHCRWMPYILNPVRRSFRYKCPNNGFITGVISYFYKASKDRRFGIKCCNVPGYNHYNCQTMPYMNSFGGLLNYIVPRGYWLIGVSSDYSSSFSDRRWKFEICQVKLRPSCGKK